jgi:hypothetical protein
MCGGPPHSQKISVTPACTTAFAAPSIKGGNAQEAGFAKLG